MAILPFICTIIQTNKADRQIQFVLIKLFIDCLGRLTCVSVYIFVRNSRSRIWVGRYTKQAKFTEFTIVYGKKTWTDPSFWQNE